MNKHLYAAALPFVLLAATTWVVHANRAPARTLTLPEDFNPGAAFSTIKAPAILEELERRGYALSDILKASGAATSNAELLANSPMYASLAQELTADIEATRTRENKVAATSGKVGSGMAFGRRLFDPKWLSSSKARYELIGVLNRLDRVAFDAESCGELRLIYRLSYSESSKSIRSRLPLTLNVIYQVPGNSRDDWQTCRKFAGAWRYPSDRSADELVDWMVSDQGPIGPSYLDKDRLRFVEANLQVIRVPSAVRPAMGGHAEYLLRSYQPRDNRLEPAYLENTPDVDRILADSALRAELVEFLRDPDQVRRLNAGVLVLPEKFLTKKASSFSPYGISRKENRLFSQILSPKDFDRTKSDEAVEFKPEGMVRTADAAIRRLNDLSCVGCHQGSATAGFHFLGIDHEATHSLNALKFEGSGHFALELKRRKRYLDRVNSGLVPDPRRDFSMAPPDGDPAMYGQPCGLPTTKGFAHWTCDTGTTCQKLDSEPKDQELGRCLPAKLHAGDACVAAEVSQAGHNSDTLTSIKQMRCEGRATCQAPKGGFPSGMCAAPDCSSIDPETEVCGHFAGNGFNQCIGAPGASFEDCLDKTSSRGARGRCDETRPCRHDYVCARTQSNEGACIPSYFLFQVRLDGHPEP